jgi:hypothetical protein
MNVSYFKRLHKFRAFSAKPRILMGSLYRNFISWFMNPDGQTILPKSWEQWLRLKNEAGEDVPVVRQEVSQEARERMDKGKIKV